MSVTMCQEKQGLTVICLSHFLWKAVWAGGTARKSHGVLSAEIFPMRPPFSDDLSQLPETCKPLGPDMDDTRASRTCSVISTRGLYVTYEYPRVHYLVEIQVQFPSNLPPAPLPRIRISNCSRLDICLFRLWSVTEYCLPGDSSRRSSHLVYDADSS